MFSRPVGRVIGGTDIFGLTLRTFDGILDGVAALYLPLRSRTVTVGLWCGTLTGPSASAESASGTGTSRHVYSPYLVCRGTEHSNIQCCINITRFQIESQRPFDSTSEYTRNNVPLLYRHPGLQHERGRFCSAHIHTPTLAKCIARPTLIRKNIALYLPPTCCIMAHGQLHSSSQEFVPWTLDFKTK